MMQKIKKWQLPQSSFKEVVTSVVSTGIKVPTVQTMVKTKRPKKGKWDFEESVGIVALGAIKSKNAKLKEKMLAEELDRA